MSLSQNPLHIFTNHIFSVLIAAFATLVIFSASASPVHARGTGYNGPLYSAQLENPAKSSKIIVKNGVFRCDGNSCAGGRSGSSKAAVCRKLARKMGPLTSFSHKGKAFDADALAKCNR